jgi:hypothetical protein
VGAPGTARGGDQARQLSGVVGLPIDVVDHVDVLAPDLRGEPSRVVGLVAGSDEVMCVPFRSEVEPLGLV